MKHTTGEVVSKFLHVQAKKAAGKGAHVAAHCEVVAVGPGGEGAKSNGKESFSLHRDYKDYRPLIERLQKAGELSTKSGAMCLIRFAGIRGGEHVLVVGTGKDRGGIDALGPVERLRRLSAQIVQKLQAEKIKSATVHLDSFLLPSARLGMDGAAAAYAFGEGAGLSAYRFKNYFSKKEDDKESPVSLTLVAALSSRVAAYQKGLERAQATVLGTEICRDLGNEPSNELSPSELANRAKDLSEKYGLKLRVLDEVLLKKEKMGLLLGVGQGSERPPRLIVLEYVPAGKKTKTIAFVGKGVTFDSGGISIKPSSRMEDMKHDMCGAAAVLGAVAACAKLKVKNRILAVVGAAENMPDGRAICPGNILTSRAGKTVEISNTDAEGRLVLADALDFVQDMKPDYVIDLATLTGAVTITLGKSCAGLMGNDSAFNKAVQTAARVSGERVWELPLFEEYFEDLKSEYADMRNSGDSPSHGTAKGAMFLKQFIRKGTRWAHLDIAAMAYGIGNVPYYPKKSSTGYGVRLLVELAQGI